ncbi:hypothetical protein PVAP13_6NG010531 [Panicum virgatum]|uniref:Uncharacterized protein n=1 Tax=Panicum virgatum TaxID=38727 RepID=A0A8T0QSR4_PANVG|nr:hypothetical protein PVAP13_6NG010531 [Panicum virgatum]KAG2576158.1 hypothetical protein PVAP13_6NG010531 [Panicum virgatum]
MRRRSSSRPHVDPQPALAHVHHCGSPSTSSARHAVPAAQPYASPGCRADAAPTPPCPRRPNLILEVRAPTSSSSAPRRRPAPAPCAAATTSSPAPRPDVALHRPRPPRVHSWYQDLGVRLVKAR